MPNRTDGGPRQARMAREAAGEHGVWHCTPEFQWQPAWLGDFGGVAPAAVSFPWGASSSRSFLRAKKERQGTKMKGSSWQRIAGKDGSFRVSFHSCGYRLSLLRT